MTTGTGTGKQDATVRAVIAQYTPRFISNGTDYGDVTDTLSSISRWDEWCDKWGETAGKYERIAREAEEAGNAVTAAGAWRRAFLCWHWGKFVYTEYPEQQAAASKRAIDCYLRSIGALDPPATRLEIPYREGVDIPAYLRVPARSEGPVPVVVMIPGLDSVKEEMEAISQYLLSRGLATLAIDGPGQGELEHRLPLTPAYEEVVTACLDALEQLPQADKGRFALFGRSLGGYAACRAAAFDPRVRATVDLSGPFCMADHWEERGLLAQTTFQNRSGARTLEEAREIASTFTLAGVASRISSPLLVIHGALDRLISTDQARRIAEEASQADFVLYEDGNHGLNNYAFQARSLLADWLTRKLTGQAG